MLLVPTHTLKIKKNAMLLHRSYWRLGLVSLLYLINYRLVTHKSFTFLINNVDMHRQAVGQKSLSLGFFMSRIAYAFSKKFLF